MGDHCLPPCFFHTRCYAKTQTTPRLSTTENPKQDFDPNYFSYIISSHSFSKAMNNRLYAFMNSGRKSELLRGKKKLLPSQNYYFSPNWLVTAPFQFLFYIFKNIIGVDLQRVYQFFVLLNKVLAAYLIVECLNMTVIQELLR